MMLRAHPQAECTLWAIQLTQFACNTEVGRAAEHRRSGDCIAKHQSILHLPIQQVRGCLWARSTPRQIHQNVFQHVHQDFLIFPLSFFLKEQR